MDFNRLIGMIARLFMRKAVGKGIAAATRAGRKAGGTAGGGQGGSAGKTPPAPGGNSRDMVKRARQAARITRRMGR